MTTATTTATGTAASKPAVIVARTNKLGAFIHPRHVADIGTPRDRSYTTFYHALVARGFVLPHVVCIYRETDRGGASYQPIFTLPTDLIRAIVADPENVVVELGNGKTGAAEYYVIDPSEILTADSFRKLISYRETPTAGAVALENLSPTYRRLNVNGSTIRFPGFVQQPILSAERSGSRNGARSAPTVNYSELFADVNANPETIPTAPVTDAKPVTDTGDHHPVPATKPAAPKLAVNKTSTAKS